MKVFGSDNDAEMPAEDWISYSDLRDVKRYLEGGRKYKDFSNEEISRKWTESMRHLSVVGFAHEGIERSDLEAELRLRGRLPDYDLVRNELTQIINRAIADHGVDAWGTNQSAIFERQVALKKAPPSERATATEVADQQVSTRARSV